MSERLFPADVPTRGTFGRKGTIRARIDTYTYLVDFFDNVGGTEIAVVPDGRTYARGTFVRAEWANEGGTWIIEGQVGLVASTYPVVVGFDNVSGTPADVLRIYPFSPTDGWGAQEPTFADALLEPTRVYHCAWSHDKQYLAVSWNITGGDSAISVFRYVNDQTLELVDTITKLHIGGLVDWSPSDQYIAGISGATSTNAREVTIYKFEGDTLTEVSSRTSSVGSGIPGTYFAVKWNRQETFVAFGHASGFAVCSWNGGTETLGAAITQALPGGLQVSVNGLDWSVDGDWLFVVQSGGTETNRLRVYPFDGSALGSPILRTLTGVTRHGEMNPAGNVFAVGADTSVSEPSGLLLYPWDGSDLGTPDESDLVSVEKLCWTGNDRIFVAGEDEAASFEVSGATIGALLTTGAIAGASARAIAPRPT